MPKLAEITNSHRYFHHSYVGERKSITIDPVLFYGEVDGIVKVYINSSGINNLVFRGKYKDGVALQSNSYTVESGYGNGSGVYFAVYLNGKPIPDEVLYEIIVRFDF